MSLEDMAGLTTDETNELENTLDVFMDIQDCSFPSLDDSHSSTEGLSVARGTKRTPIPSYMDMVSKAIGVLGGKKGSSRLAIFNFIRNNYDLGNRSVKAVNNQIKRTLKKGVDTGVFKQVSGTGANGSFVIADNGPNKSESRKRKQSTTEKESSKDGSQVKRARGTRGAAKAR
uniref:H15 domain-containing protein n=1 Tax=Strongyloides papillosus TaxID=174720 RepID=A0A0N5BBS5_STREA